MRLYGIRIEYLHGLAEVDHLDEFVDLLVVVIVTEYEQRVLDAPSTGQAHDGVPEVHDSRVDLEHNTSVNGENKYHSWFSSTVYSRAAFDHYLFFFQILNYTKTVRGTTCSEFKCAHKLFRILVPTANFR